MATRILRHLTANEVQLFPMPFKRELSMEAYLVENENILSLDNDVFSDVNIIQEELTLKQGRSSKDTDGRIDILITYSSDYIGIVELKLGQLENIHLEQLEDYLLQKDQILEQFPDDLSLESKWIGLMVGSSISSEMADKISNGYTTESGIQIAALTIQRFCGKDGSIYVTTDSYFKDQSSSKDRTKYKFSGKTFGKGRLALEIIKEHVAINPEITFSKLEKEFPKELQGAKGVFSTSKDANQEMIKGRKRHFIKPDELITLADETIAVSSQWGIDNIASLIEHAKKLGHEITVYSE